MIVQDIELGGEEVNTDEVATPDDDLGESC